MLVTEAMLAPYRKASSRVSLRSIGKYTGAHILPEDWFSATHRLFDSAWHPNGGAGKSDLTVTPVLAFTENVPPLNPAYSWMALVHQKGAHSCSRQHMIAMRLSPNKALLPRLNAIAREGYGADLGHFDQGQMIVSRITKYVAELLELGLDCEATWRLLEEAIYPIDATQANMDIVADKPPKVLDVAEWGKSPPVRYATDPVILLLTHNSD